MNWRLPRHILAQASVEVALSFVKDQLVDPDAYIARVREILAQVTGG